MNSDATEPQAGVSTTPDDALAELVAGNGRFVAGTPHHQLNLESARIATIDRQQPIAMVLTCADSRVVPEFIFDQGIGRLFVVRIAGNVPLEGVVGTFEFALAQFGPPVLLVLGHRGCGALHAAAALVAANESPSPHLAPVVAALRPALLATADAGDDRLLEAVRANVRFGLRALLERSELLAAAVEAGRLRAVGAEYVPETGRVALI